MGIRNKRAGSNYEREGVDLHKRYFKDVATTRACNRARDGEGIDLCNTHELELGRFPLDLQYKTAATTTIPYPHILEEMKGNHKVTFHRRTRKSEGGIFKVKGKYAITTEKTYELFLQHIYAIQLLRIKNPELVESLEKDFNLQLLNCPQQVQTDYQAYLKSLEKKPRKKKP